ncbi:hypothetical protein MRB53_002001 [Persea americana]|uniref:Uncharacterized protein n=1 Tax=Persea americana TaxID=3435 RepID=A0ACC2MTX0_PERAE|nr:hypothetical protein MRB53_002001 [Persea americana]
MPIGGVVQAACVVCLLCGWLCAGIDCCAVVWCSGRPCVYVPHAGRSIDLVLLAIDGMTEVAGTQLRQTDRSVWCMAVGVWHSVRDRKQP